MTQTIYTLRAARPMQHCVDDQGIFSRTGELKQFARGETVKVPEDIARDLLGEKVLEVISETPAEGKE